MSQRTADELENRRGLTLGLTLAEVLLLLLFLVLLALGWRVQSLQREHQTAIAIRDHENARLRAAQAIGSDPEKLKIIDAAIRAASEINPNDPAEVLVRSVTILRRLGNDTQPDQLRPLSEMLRDSEKVRALDRAITLAILINPHDPAEALTRAAEVLTRLGPDTKPDEVLPLEKMTSLATELDRVTRERNNLMRTGNGLTYPSCWTTSEGKTQYMFDITIQDAGMIVRDATPSRGEDAALHLVAGLARKVLTRESAFRTATLEVFNYSKERNCRFYSIIRDQTGPTSKARYKELRAIVENHFYPLHLTGAWSDTPMGGPLVVPKR